MPRPQESVSEPRTETGAGPGSTTTRRGLLSVVWTVLGVAAVGEAVWIAASFLRPRERSRAGDGGSALVVAGPVGDFAPGSVTAFPVGKFYLVRLSDGGFLALDRRCTHLGCTVPWVEEEQRFACPCHASAFDITGSLLSPPAPRPLDLYPVRIENGIVKVDTRAPVRRQAFEPSQVVRS